MRECTLSRPIFLPANFTEPSFWLTTPAITRIIGGDFRIGLKRLLV